MRKASEDAAPALLRRPKRPRRYLAGGLDILNDHQQARRSEVKDDPLLLAARAALEVEWKQRIRHQLPAEREAWLRAAAHIAVLTARRLADLRRPVLRVREDLEERVPSASWFDAAWNEGAAFPPPGMVGCLGLVRYSSVSDLDAASDLAEDPWPRRRAYAHSDRRDATPRYCPPQNVEQEAWLDNLEPLDLRCWCGPVSPSAAAIRHIADRHAQEEPGADMESEDGRAVDADAPVVARIRRLRRAWSSLHT